MSSDESPHAPMKRDRREAVRAKAQQVQAQQARARVIRRSVLGVASVAVVAVLVGAVIWVVADNASKPLLSPANVDGDGFLVTEASGIAAAAPAAGADLGSAATDPAPDATAADDAPVDKTSDSTPTAKADVDIRIYVDYLSESSRTFQVANGQQLASWINQGSTSVTYYPVAMLTAKSNGTKYSVRAASAAACVATYSPSDFFAYNQELLAQQPPVDSDGYSDAELASLAIATGAGSPQRVRNCIESESFVAWARGATDRALDEIPDTDGLALTGTPTVLVNGQQYVGALDDPAEFSQFVLTVDSDAYYKPSPSPTPTGSATPTPTATPSPTP